MATEGGACREIPEDEPVYRRFHSDHVVNGQVMPEGLDVPICCGNRASRSRAEDVLRLGDYPDFVFVGSVCRAAAALVGPLVRESDGALLGWTICDDPNPPEDPTNAAHCVVRVWVRLPVKKTIMKSWAEPSYMKKRPPVGVAAMLTEALANKWRVLGEWDPTTKALKHS